MSRPKRSKEKSDFTGEMTGLGRASLAALAAGLLIGGIGTGFRLGLDWLGVKYIGFVEWAHAWPWLGWIFPVLLGAIGAGLSRLLVRPHPVASGSGVQHVEAVMRGEAEPASLAIVPIKFLGGWLGIGSGLALGREGPTIQMGATLGAWLAQQLHCAKEAMRDVQAALGGAGLAVAFNAPIAGALFVFEEVSHSFRLRLTVVTLLGTAAAMAVARSIMGSTPDFQVTSLVAGEPWTLGLHFLLGSLLGFLGILYNRTTLFGLETLARLLSWPTEFRAALVGAVIGAVAWFFPMLVGSGDSICQEILKGGALLSPLFFILVLRWFIGPLSYSAGTPGGLFSPLLLIGAATGALFAGVFNYVAPAGYEISVTAFAIVGMTAFFTGVVRAPLTGIVLITEMTATTTLMVPLLAGALGAMLVCSLMRGEPLYDILRRRMLASHSTH